MYNSKHPIEYRHIQLRPFIGYMHTWMNQLYSVGIGGGSCILSELRCFRKLSESLEGVAYALSVPKMERFQTSALFVVRS